MMHSSALDMEPLCGNRLVEQRERVEISVGLPKEEKEVINTFHLGYATLTRLPTSLL